MKCHPPLFPLLAVPLVLLPGSPKAMDRTSTGLHAVLCPRPCRCSEVLFPLLPKPVLTVNCSHSELTGTPLGMANNSEALLLSHNDLLNVSSLPTLPVLRLLDLSHNHIVSLEGQPFIHNMGLLIRLNLAENAIGKLGDECFKGLGSLEVLDVSYNNISTVEVQAFVGLQHLSVLRLGYNRLKELNRSWFTPLTSLRELYVQGNHITIIDCNTFDQATSLLHVDLSHNGLKTVSDKGFVGLDHVKVLNMSDNELATIPTQELRRLSSLDILLLDGIHVTSLQQHDFENLNVSSISLSYLPHLTVVSKEAFSNLSRLRTLQLHDNDKLIFIHPEAFHQVPLLHRLVVHNNQLLALSSSIKDSVPELNELHLYHNPLHCDCNIFWLRRDMVLTDASVNDSAVSYIRNGDKLMCSSPEASSMKMLRQVPTQHLSPVCAPTSLPFFTDSHSLSIGDDLQLQCQAIGEPRPLLSWILPDGTIINSSTDSRVSQDNTVFLLPGVGLPDQGTYSCKAENGLGYDISSTAVTVRNRHIQLSLTQQNDKDVTVTLLGSIPLHHISLFRIVCQRNGGSREIRMVWLQPSVFNYTLTDLLPGASYQVCLMYRDSWAVQCGNITTRSTALFAWSSRSRVLTTRLVATACAMVCVLMGLCLIRVLRRRRRRRRQREEKESYRDSLTEDKEMEEILLDPIDMRAPDSPPCTVRTALLPRSYI